MQYVITDGQGRYLIKFKPGAEHKYGWTFNKTLALTMSEREGTALLSSAPPTTGMVKLEGLRVPQLMTEHRFVVKAPSPPPTVVKTTIHVVTTPDKKEIKVASSTLSVKEPPKVDLSALANLAKLKPKNASSSGEGGREGKQTAAK